MEPSQMCVTKDAEFCRFFLVFLDSRDFGGLLIGNFVPLWRLHRLPQIQAQSTQYIFSIPMY